MDFVILVGVDRIAEYGPVGTKAEKMQIHKGNVSDFTWVFEGGRNSGLWAGGLVGTKAEKKQKMSSWVGGRKAVRAGMSRCPHSGSEPRCVLSKFKADFR